MQKIILLVLFTPLINFAQSGWVYQQTGITKGINKVYFFDSNTGWACSRESFMFSTHGYFIRTIDGGSNWSTIIDNSYQINDFSFIDGVTGWFVSSFANDVGQNSRHIYKTTNSGINWIRIFSDTMTGGSINSVKFFNLNTGIVLGYKYFSPNYFPETFKTTNGGINWSLSSISGLNSFRLGFTFTNVNTGWMYSSRDTNIIFNTTNGGQSWIRIYTFTNSSIINYIYVSPNNTLWTVRENGLIYKSTDNGLNWIQKISGTANNLSCIYFVNENTGWISGWYHTILKTTNGGDSWTSLDVGTQGDYYSIYFINESTGWSSGGLSFIGNVAYMLKTTSGGEPTFINPITNEVPNHFSLGQNYPNPFNPITKIRFDIESNIKSQTSNVKLIVFDVLGREVITLVNEKLTAGTYEVDWDGSNFASGIYYYQLIASEYIETKKMIILK